MDVEVVLEATLPVETFMADGTHKRLLCGVYEIVTRQTGFPTERLVANAALVRPQARMDDLVAPQVCLVSERLVTLFTGVRPRAVDGGVLHEL